MGNTDPANPQEGDYACIVSGAAAARCAKLGHSDEVEVGHQLAQRAHVRLELREQRHLDVRP